MYEGYVYLPVGYAKVKKCAAPTPISLAGTLIKLAIIGDIHDLWDERDAHALAFLRPDAAIFVGKFCFTLFPFTFLSDPPYGLML